MPLLSLLYLLALVLMCAAAWLWGGRVERWVAAAIVLASIATLVARVPTRGAGAEYGVMIVDTGLLLVLVGVALRCDRFWPLAACAFHLVSMTVHLAKVVDPTVAWMPYLHANAFWAYPMVSAVGLGAWIEGPNGRRRALA